MSAGSIVLAHYLPHDEIFQPLGLWREEVRYLLSREPLSLCIKYNMVHAAVLLDGECGVSWHDRKHLVEKNVEQHLVSLNPGIRRLTLDGFRL